MFGNEMIPMVSRAKKDKIMTNISEQYLVMGSFEFVFSPDTIKIIF
jgi:hypothetical protein